MAQDIEEWVLDNYNIANLTATMSIEEAHEEMYEKLWVEDSVTGNASGSYTFNSYQAEEYLAGNWDMLAMALDEFGENDVRVLQKGAEWCDVTIRCWLLGEILQYVLEDLYRDYAEGLFNDEYDESEVNKDE